MRPFQSRAYEVLISDAAQKDLDDIFAYINEKILSLQAASNTLNTIRLAILTVAEIGIVVSKKLNKEFRDSELFLIFYIISDQEVVVLCVLYQQRQRHWFEIFG